VCTTKDYFIEMSKPANVFLSGSNDALLGDLGLAIHMNPDGTSAARGTIQTMAPEAVGPAGICSVSSDVYSLAATLFFFIAGQYPVYNRGDVASKVLAGDRRHIRDVAPHVSQTVGSVIEKSLSFDPAGRAASARDFANQLGHARCHNRSWTLVADHDDHRICLRGEPARMRRAINVCSVQAGAKWNIEVYHDGGSHVRRKELKNLSWAESLVGLRKLASEL